MLGIDIFDQNPDLWEKFNKLMQNPKLKEIFTKFGGRLEVAKIPSQQSIGEELANALWNSDELVFTESLNKKIQEEAGNFEFKPLSNESFKHFQEELAAYGIDFDFSKKYFNVEAYYGIPGSGKTHQALTEKDKTTLTTDTILEKLRETKIASYSIQPSTSKPEFKLLECMLIICLFLSGTFNDTKTQYILDLGGLAIMNPLTTKFLISQLPLENLIFFNGAKNPETIIFRHINNSVNKEKTFMTSMATDTSDKITETIKTLCNQIIKGTPDESQRLSNLISAIKEQTPDIQNEFKKLLNTVTGKYFRDTVYSEEVHKELSDTKI